MLGNYFQKESFNKKWWKIKKLAIKKIKKKFDIKVKRNHILRDEIEK
jgi:hypothetical protein